MNEVRVITRMTLDFLGFSNSAITIIEYHKPLHKLLILHLAHNHQTDIRTLLNATFDKLCSMSNHFLNIIIGK